MDPGWGEACAIIPLLARMEVRPLAVDDTAWQELTKRVRNRYRCGLWIAAAPVEAVLFVRGGVRAVRLSDPVWGAIEIDEATEGLTSKPGLREEMHRLLGLKQLGVTWVDFPGAIYSKREHHLGMYHLAQFVPLAAQERKSLARLALLEGIGHLPYGYATERAVLEAARSDAAFKDKLVSLLEPVAELASRYKDKASLSVANMVDAIAYKELYRWFTAIKVKALPVDVYIGHRERIVYNYITGDGLAWWINELHRLDYLHRDLLYTGVASMRLSAESIRAFIDKPRGDGWGILTGLRHFLDENVYFRPSTAGREIMLTSLIQEAVLNDFSLVEQMLHMTDEDLERRLSSEHITLQDIVARKFEGVAKETLVGVGFAQAVEQAGNGDLTHGVVVSSKVDGSHNVRLDVLIDAQQQADAYRIADSISKLASGPGDVEGLSGTPHGEELFGVLVGHTVKSKAMRHLAGMLLTLHRGNPADRKHIIDVLLDSGSPQLSPELRLRLATLALDIGFEHRLPKERPSLDDLQNAVLAAARRRDLFRQLRTARREFGRVLREIPDLPGHFEEPDRIEFIAWLYEACASTDETILWLLPQITDGRSFEVDLVAIRVGKGVVEVDLVECTKSDGDVKREQDHQKINRIARDIVRRWPKVSCHRITVGRAPESIAPETLVELLSAKEELRPLHLLFGESAAGEGVEA